MAKNSSRSVGRHFLHIPGPTPLPDRVLRAMDTPIIDHRGLERRQLFRDFLVFEDGCNRFPGFSYEVQGVYQSVEDGKVRFNTYVVKE